MMTDIAQAANLTTVRQNPLEMGRNAARKTLSLLRGQTPDASYESQEATVTPPDAWRPTVRDGSSVFSERNERNMEGYGPM